MAEPPSRRERERERHRQEILAAAEALLLQRGMDATTMDDIAAASEFAVGTLYRYFKSKEDLAVALVHDRVQSLAEGLESVPSGLGFAERLDVLLEVWRGEAQRAYPLVHVLFSGQRPISKPDDEHGELACIFDRVVDATAQVMAQGAQEGVLNEQPRTMAVALLTLLHGLTRDAWRHHHTDFGPVVALTRRVFLDGFRQRSGEQT